MFKLNLKIALRNLFKNKVYAAINIIGLALGLTAFVLLLLFINHEVNYDRWDSELEKVYQVREKHDFFSPDNKEHWQDITDSRTANLLRTNVPQFKSVTKVDQNRGQTFSIKIDNQEPLLVQNVKDADSAFFKVFPYQFLKGDRISALNSPKSVVLKQSFAKQLFGTDKVLGKVIKVVMWRDDPGTSLKITGIVADPTTSESVKFNAIMRTGEKDKDPENLNSSHYCEVYALANVKLDTTSINRTMQKVYMGFKKSMFTQLNTPINELYNDGKSPGLKVIPLQAVHSSPIYASNWLGKITPVIALSIFLLLISIINFVNLSTAQSVQRAKEVGVKKVLGAYKKQLIIQFLIESAIQCLAALFISIILVEVLLPAFNTKFDVQLNFWYNDQLLQLILQLFGVFVLVTLLSGFYPAVVLSKYNPVKVLKGNYESGFGGLTLRNGLVVIQFIIAVTFIIGIGVINEQANYVANKDLGFNKDKLINILTNYNTNDPFVEGIKRIPGVKYVATTTQVIGNTFNVPREINFNNKAFNINSVTITIDALPALGAKVVSGRIFAREYAQDTINTVVLNQTAANLLGKNLIGKTFKSGQANDVFQIVGIIKDYHNEGFDKAVLPTVYKVTRLGGTSNTNNLLVRFDTENYQNIIKTIENEWKKVYPDFPMRYSTVEDAFNNELKPTKRLLQVVTLFSVISVLLSLLGLFALSAFMAKRKTKEIAIRKILGASDFQIINMLNRSFMILVLIANLISWPVAFILTRKWLEGFAYRIDMPIFPFIIASLISVVIAVFTVSLQARKAAVTNPVNALKYE